MKTEDIIVEEDLDNRNDSYRDLYARLVKYTKGFANLSGRFPVETKSEAENVESILKDHYHFAEKHGLDYDNASLDGTSYIVEFRDPIRDDEGFGEAFDEEEFKNGGLEWIENKAPTAGPIAGGLVGGGMGESLEDSKILDMFLEDVEKHDELNPDLWDESKELRPEVKDKIEEIVQKFDDNLKENEVELEVKDIVIIGSSANYNYTNSSDIDVHIIADLTPYKDSPDLAMKCYQAYKSLFNNKYDPTIRGHEVEIYVEPEAIHANSNGQYSLKDGWIKEPVKDNIPDVDQSEIDDKVEPYIERAKACDTIEDIDKLIDDLYVLRQDSIIKDGEFGEGNLIFKEMRNKGYLQALKDKKVELENKEMSLEALDEKLVYGIFTQGDDGRREVDRVNSQKRAEDRVAELGNDYWWDEIDENLDKVGLAAEMLVEDTIKCDHEELKFGGSLLESAGELNACDIAEEITELAFKKGVYPELDTCEAGPMNSIICSFYLSGDWKHEHLLFERLVEDYCNEHGLAIFNSKNEEIGNSDSDYYESIHTFYIINKDDEEKFNSMRRAFNGGEALDEDLYKGFGIDYNLYGQNEYSVQTPEGDDIMFETEEEAKKFIDTLVDDEALDESGEDFFEPWDHDDDDNETIYLYSQDYDGTPESLEAIRKDLMDHYVYDDEDKKWVDEIVARIAAGDKGVDEALDPAKDPATIATKAYHKRKPKVLKKGEMVTSQFSNPFAGGAVGAVSEEVRSDIVDKLAAKANKLQARLDNATDDIEAAYATGQLDAIEDAAHLVNQEAEAGMLTEADVNGNTMTVQDVHTLIEDFLNGCNLINWDCTDDHFDIDYSEEALQLCANDDVREMFESGIGIDIEQFEDAGEADDIIGVLINYGGDMAADGQEEYFNYPDESNDKHKAYLLDTLNNLVSDEAVKYNIEESNKEYANLGEGQLKEEAPEEDDFGDFDFKSKDENVAYSVLGYDEDGNPIDVSPWTYHREYGVDGQQLYPTAKEAIEVAELTPEAKAVAKVHYEGDTGLVNAMILDEPKIVWEKEEFIDIPNDIVDEAKKKRDYTLTEEE